MNEKKGVGKIRLVLLLIKLVSSVGVTEFYKSEREQPFRSKTSPI